MIKLQLRSKMIFATIILSLLASDVVFAQRRETSRTNSSNVDPENHDTLVDSKLAETNLYELYGRGLEKSCSSPKRPPMITMVLKVAEDFSVSETNESYRNIVENEVIPLVKKQCGDFEELYVSNYLKGIRLARISEPGFWDYGKDYSVNDPNFSGREYSLVNFLIRIDIQGKVRYSRIGGAGNETSLAAIRKQFTSSEKLKETKKIEESQSYAESQRKVKEQKINSQKTKAGSVLALYKKGAGKEYNFAGFSQQESLQNIYKGNFEEFTGGYEQSIINETVRAQASLYLSRAPLDDIFKENKRLTELMLKISQLRAPIMIAYFAYHQAYEGQCSTNKEIAWKDGTRRVDLVKMRGAIEVSRIRGNTFYFSVREPFYDTFVKSLNVGTDGLSAELLTGTPASTGQLFQNDFVKFLKKEGCASAKVRHFESNLYLATEWLLPLQELIPPEILQSQSTETENRKPQPEVKKKVPVTKKPQEKTRRKN